MRKKRRPLQIVSVSFFVGRCCFCCCCLCLLGSLVIPGHASYAGHLSISFSILILLSCMSSFFAPLAAFSLSRKQKQNAECRNVQFEGGVESTKHGPGKRHHHRHRKAACCPCFTSPHTTTTAADHPPPAASKPPLNPFIHEQPPRHRVHIPMRMRDAR